VNQEWHVAVLGQEPPPELREELETILARGEPTDLPEEIFKTLASRRAEAIRPAPWTERHFRPGQRL
jgi:hypothetical protein